MNLNFIGGITKHLAVGFVFISSLVMGYILYELETTKQNFANQLVEQSSDRIKTELDQFFLPVKAQILTLKQQKTLNLFDDFSNEKLNQFYIPIINRYPQISSIGIADSRGYEINILPGSEKGNWLNREVNVEEWGMIEKWSLWKDENGLNENESWINELEEDPRNRPWYKGVVENNGTQIHWTEPYLFLTNNEIGLTASIEWSSNPGNTQTEILALDITLTDITQLSQGLSITDNNQIFILTQKDKSIIGLPQKHEELNPDNMKDKLLSTPDEFGNTALISLLELPLNKIVSFSSSGETWWGILDSYTINDSQELQVAVMIPESDFASEINSTERAMIAGFLVIILLATLLVRSHNRLRKAKTSLNEQNGIITNQKERLFAEVHHRVKNNLAIMAALMELENMESNDAAVKDILTQTQRRVKSMSAVHEIMYKTDDVNKVQITEFIPGIINFSKKDFNDIDVELDLNIDEILINVNQALTYALLLNEFMSSILKAQIDISESVVFQVLQKNNRMVTAIKICTDTDYLKTRKGVGKQLIQVLLAQLGADFNTNIHEDYITYQISFELKDKKGTTSNYNYS